MREFIKKYSYFYGSAIALALIIWSCVEPGFYNNYIDGNVYLIWTVYVFPWVVLVMLWIHYYVNNIKNK